MLRPNPEISNVMQFLEALHNDMHPQAVKRAPKERKLTFITYITKEMKSFIVWLRFGSLTEEGEPLRTLQEISNLTGIKRSSVFSVIS